MILLAATAAAMAAEHPASIFEAPEPDSNKVAHDIATQEKGYWTTVESVGAGAGQSPSPAEQVAVSLSAASHADPCPDWAVEIVYVLSPQSAAQVDHAPAQSTVGVGAGVSVGAVS